jgi:hypothetical protein
LNEDNVPANALLPVPWSRSEDRHCPPESGSDETNVQPRVQAKDRQAGDRSECDGARDVHDDGAGLKEAST